jgi:hypothetical protein
MTEARGVDAFEERLSAYLFERSEEARAVRVGEKEVSERAVIVERYADLFTREQLAALEAAAASLDGTAHERATRLRLTCEAGIIATELAAREDALENALLEVRVPWQGQELPLRSAQAQLATLPAYADRDALGVMQREASAAFNDERLALLRDHERLAAELSGTEDPVQRSDAEKGISSEALAVALDGAAGRTAEAFERLRGRWFERLLGPDRDERPASSHTAWMRRLSPLARTYTKERSVPVCVATLSALGLDIEREPGIRLDLDDRPQKSPRACVIASDPPRVVHLITRAQGGIHDYEAFLHEAGHALHYAGCEPGLAYTFRMLARDHALTEIYSFLLDSILREPGWHEEHFGLPGPIAADHAQATVFLNALLFRRYAAKLRFELEFWKRFREDGGTASGYAERLTEATGVAYHPDGFLADMDAGLYSADYLRAWIRAAQVRARLRDDVGRDWWRRPETGTFLRELFREGTRPSSEDVAGRVGFDPLDTGPLEQELGG